MPYIEDTKSLEKIISARIIQEDAEAIFSLLKTERDPVFSMEIIPYYALFIQACQEYIDDALVEDCIGKRIKDIRNYLKAYGEGFGKTKKKINLIDMKQDEQYRTQMRFGFKKNWNIHSNLGTYWTQDRHIVGNTQILADFLELDNIFCSESTNVQYEFGKQIGSYISSIREGMSQGVTPPIIKRSKVGTSIDYYYDLNTNKMGKLFVDNSNKTLNLFFLNILCNMNFVKYVLKPLF